mmetsp:Transcript_7522/g.13591  ORF Transcript_7522/g.13591 Transcript_7522/m.13591 type:complete len:291 (-) Transcript_7522:302-1174(-)
MKFSSIFNPRYCTRHVFPHPNSWIRRKIRRFTTDSNPIYLRHIPSGSEIYVIGTSHISTQSVRDVHHLIESMKPNVVCLELDSKRALHLIQRNKQGNDFLTQFTSNPQFNHGIHAETVLKMLREFVSKLDVGQSGNEFAMALDLCKTLNIRVEYIDQDANSTLEHMKHAFFCKDLPNLISNPFKTPIGTFVLEKMVQSVFVARNERNTQKNDEMHKIDGLPGRSVAREMTQNVRYWTPHVVQEVVDKRDAIMVENIKTLLSNETSARRVVAVVGLAHLDGIERLWNAAKW